MPSHTITRGRKPANSVRWAQQPWIEVPDRRTDFEGVVARLGLSGKPEAWARSRALKNWTRTHKHHRYIPEELLRAWGFEDVDFNWAREKESA
jgi:hypothetical protein